MQNPITIFARARHNLALTPGERAFLRALSALWQTGLAAGTVAIIEALAQGGQPLTTQDLAQVGVVAGACAIIQAIAKFISAHGDVAGPLSAPVRGAIADGITLTAEEIAARYGGQPNDVKAPA